MLMPRFSIRTLLVIITIAAFASIIAGMAVRGQHWAWGITIGIVSLGFAMLVQAAWFGVVWMLSQIQSRRQKAPIRPKD